MRVAPVILRELQVAARRRETWALRLVFSVGFGCAYLAATFIARASGPLLGAVALEFLAVTGLVLCLGSGPYLTADSIAVEKREGTLGLLLLTPLRAMHVVIGKMFTHSFQAALAVLAALPFLFLPLLVGGVLWSEVLRVLVALFAALFLSLAAGMSCSVLTDDARSAAIGTLSTILLFVFAPWAWPLLGKVLTGGAMSPLGLPMLSPITSMNFAYDAAYRRLTAPPPIGVPGSFVFWVSILLQVVVATALVVIAGRLVTRVWRGDLSGRTETADTVWRRWIARFRRRGSPPPRDSPPARSEAGPVVGLADADREERRPRTGPRDSPPLVWLASRAIAEGPGSRVLRGAILLFIAGSLVVSTVTSLPQQGFSVACLAAFALHVLTKFQASWTVTRWLRDSCRSGALELICTTPIEDAEIVEAHHRSLVAALKWPLIWLVTVNLVLQMTILVFWNHLRMDDDAARVFSAFFIGGGIVAIADLKALRWLGLREALRQPTPAKAAGRAFLALGVGPWLLLVFVVAFISGGVSPREAATIFVLWQVGSLAIDQGLERSCRVWARNGIRARISG